VFTRHKVQLFAIDPHQLRAYASVQLAPMSGEPGAKPSKQAVEQYYNVAPLPIRAPTPPSRP